MKRFFLPLFLLFFMGAFTGCAFDIVHVKQIPVEYEEAEGEKQSFLLKEDVEFGIGTGFNRKLNAGTRWHYFNTISNGDIFKTKDQVLTLEGSNIFEAYIVVSGEDLVGFYLPVEQTYCPLKKPEQLIIEKL